METNLKLGAGILKGQGINLATTYRKGKERLKERWRHCIAGTRKDAERTVARCFGNKPNHCNQETEVFYTAAFVSQVPYKKLI